MPIDFPNSPSVNDEFTAAGKVWRWSGSTWDSVPSTVSGPTGPTGPTGPRGIDTSNTYSFTLAANGSGSTTTGVLTANNVTFVNTTTLHVSFTDSNSVNVENSITSAMSSTSTNKATITVRDADNTANFVQFVATSYYPNISDARIDVTQVRSNGTVVDGASVLMTIDRAGDIGTSGVISVTGPIVNSGSTNQAVLSLDSTVALLTASQTLSNKTLASPIFNGAATEAMYSSATGFAGYTFYATTNGAVQWLYNASTANGAINITSTASQTLDTLVPANRSITVTLIVANGPTPYYPTSITVDGSAPFAVKWSGGTAPSSGNANSYDIYTFTLFKMGSPAWVVLASVVKFA